MTGVLRLLVHVYGTRCQHIYASVKVSDNLNGCSRLICLVLETAVLCDIFVRSAVYKSSYLLIYLLTAADASLPPTATNYGRALVLL